MSKLTSEDANAYLGSFFIPTVTAVCIGVMRYSLRLCHTKGQAGLLYSILVDDDRHHSLFQDRFEDKPYDPSEFRTAVPLERSS